MSVGGSEREKIYDFMVREMCEGGDEEKGGLLDGSELGYKGGGICGCGGWGMLGRV